MILKLQRRRIGPFCVAGLLAITLLHLHNLFRLQASSKQEPSFPLYYDSYLFLRYAQQVCEDGSLTEVDRLRYAPNGWPIVNELTLNAYVLAYLSKTMSWIRESRSFEEGAFLVPVILSLVAVVLYFAVSKLIFGSEVAFLSTLLLILSPSYLWRTKAGVLDRDALSLLLWIGCVLSLFLAYQVVEKKRIVAFGTAGGIATGLLALTWPGVFILTIMIAAFFCMKALIRQVDRKDAYIYFTWLVPTISMASPKGFEGIFRDYAIGWVVALTAVGAILVHQIAKLHRPKRMSGWNSLWLAATRIVLTAFGLLVLSDWLFPELWARLQYPMGNTFTMRNVVENLPSDAEVWWQRYGLLLPLVTFGFAIVCREITNTVVPVKIPVALSVLPWVIVMSLLTRSVAPRSLANGEAVMDILLVTPLVAFLIWSLILREFAKQRQRVSVANPRFNNLLFLVVWFLVSMILAQGARRFHFWLTPVAMLFCAYALTLVFKTALGKVYDRRICHLVILTLMGLVLLASDSDFMTALVSGMSLNGVKVETSKSFRLISNSVVILSSLALIFKLGTRWSPWRGWATRFVWLLNHIALTSFLIVGSRTVPGILRYSYAQVHREGTIRESLKEALFWLKTYTADHAVIASWWDLGYFIQAVSNRATVLDNGNYYPAWNQQFFEALILESDPSRLVSFLREHQAQYLLLTSYQAGQFQYILSTDPEYEETPPSRFRESLFRKLVFTEEAIPSLRRIYERSDGGLLVRIWQADID